VSAVSRGAHFLLWWQMLLAMMIGWVVAQEAVRVQAPGTFCPADGSWAKSWEFAGY
jgi:hypothetical protein